jgi:hypothetical protein
LDRLRSPRNYSPAGTLQEVRDADLLGMRPASRSMAATFRFVHTSAIAEAQIMARLLKTASILGVIAVLALGASPAPAAKGVKKTHEHHIRGKVVSVQSVKGHKGPNATLTIQVTHHKHKKNQHANAVVAQAGTRTFHLTTASRINVNNNGKNGNNNGSLGIGALRPGSHVTVFAHHHHADRVVIDHSMKRKGAKNGIQR